MTSTSGFQVPAWVMYVALGAFAVGGGYLVHAGCVRDQQYRASWHKLESDPIGGIEYAGKVEPEKLTEALGDVVQDLSKVPGWSPEKVRLALKGYRIRGRSEMRWKNYAGQWVGAETEIDLRSMSVNSTLNGLGHESAHVVEDREFGAVDYGHAQWEARGIQAAVAEYEKKWRGEQ